MTNKYWISSIGPTSPNLIYLEQQDKNMCPCTYTLLLLICSFTWTLVSFCSCKPDGALLLLSAVNLAPGPVSVSPVKMWDPGLCAFQSHADQDCSTNPCVFLAAVFGLDTLDSLINRGVPGAVLMWCVLKQRLSAPFVCTLVRAVLSTSCFFTLSCICQYPHYNSVQLLFVIDLSSRKCEFWTIGFVHWLSEWLRSPFKVPGGSSIWMTPQTYWQAKIDGWLFAAFSQPLENYAKTEMILYVSVMWKRQTSPWIESNLSFY